uniref:Fibrinogen C-terminal domain-containing protein n=1 Tax=Macrostomum lignano TaxID=282301 RepID=A0A1I8FVR7_9PLAT
AFGFGSRPLLAKCSSRQAMTELKQILPFVILTLMLAVNADGQALEFKFESSSPNLFAEFAQVTRSVASSKIHCAALCSSRSYCRTFSFSPDSSECRMSNQNGGLASFGLPEYSLGHRRRASEANTGSQCKRNIVTMTDGRQFCPIQQRVSDTSFEQSWSAYETGFGDDVNYWIGLEAIHQLSSAVANGVNLLVQVVTWEDDELQYQEYSNFLVQNGSTNYTLTVGPVDSAKSNAPESKLSLSNGGMFSTTDRDNDMLTASCSNKYHGRSGWWFRGCTLFNPNG